MSRVFERVRASSRIDFKDAQGVSPTQEGRAEQAVAKEVFDGILGNVARRQHLGIIDESAMSFAEFAKEWKRRVEPTLKPRSRSVGSVSSRST